MKYDIQFTAQFKKDLKLASMKIINVGFVCMKMDSNLAQVISGIFVLGFVAYNMNQPRIREYFDRKKKAEGFAAQFGGQA